MNIEFIKTIAPCVVNIQPISNKQSKLFVRPKNSYIYSKNRYLKRVLFFGKIAYKVKEITCKFFRIPLSRIHDDLKDLNKLESYILPEDNFEDKEFILPIPSNELKRAIYLLTPYEYKFSKTEREFREAEGLRILRLFLN